MEAAANKALETLEQTDIASYVARQRTFLQEERDAEIAEVALASADEPGLAALAAAGLAVARLSLVGIAAAHGGRVTLTLATRGGRVIDAPRLSTGDIVAVRAHVPAAAANVARAGACRGRRRGASQRETTVGCADDGETRANAKGPDAFCSVAVEGILTVLEDTRVDVVVDDGGDHDGDETALATILDGNGVHEPNRQQQQLFAVVHVGSDVTYKRYTAALSELERAAVDSTHPAFAVLGVLFRGAEPRYQDETSLVLQPSQLQLMASFNESQQAAIRHAMSAKELAVVHGPPGTGKTSTLVALVIMEVLRGSRVLVVAPSNIAVDNIAEKLASSPTKVRFVRAGHPARVMPSVIEHTLESRLAQTDEAALVRDVREELEGLRIRSISARPAERRTIRIEQRHLRKELRKREDDALRRLLARVDVVLATTSGAGARILDHATSAASFDVVCVDEAGQALEAACLVALLRGKRAVVAGDPFQLAPTVRTVRSAPGAGCDATILDRVFASHRLRTETVRVLNIQYRMNAVISNWSSNALYDGLIVPAASVSGHLLQHLPHVTQDAQNELESDDNSSQAWVLIDTAGCGFHESADDDVTPVNEGRHSRALVHASKSNRGEAEVVIKHIHALLSSGLKPSEIGIISPYSGQVKLLRAMLRDEGSRDLEVSTVDSFQGREKEAIVLSCVRSNDMGEVGFLTDSRRMNVAITRARRHVCIVCDSATVSHDKFLSAMVDYASEHADYRAADCSLTFLPQSLNFQTKMMVEDVSAQRKVPRPFLPAKSCNQRSTLRQVEKGDLDKNRKTWSDAVMVKTNRYSDVSEQMLRDRLEKEITRFIRAPRRYEHAFEPSLGSYGRLVVHEIAERLGLEHIAEGNGPDRFILIRKRSESINDSPVGEEIQTDSISTEIRYQKLSFVHLHDEQDDIGPRKVKVASDEATLGPGVEAQVVSIGSKHTDPAEEGKERKANALLHEAALARRERAHRDNCDVSSRNGAEFEPAPRIFAAGNLRERPQRIIVNGVIMDDARARTRTSTVAAKNRLHAKLSEASASRKPKGKK